MKIIERIFKDNLPSNSIVQSYKQQICNSIEEGMWIAWKVAHDIDPKEENHSDGFKQFLNKEVNHGH